MNLLLVLALVAPQADDPFKWFDTLGYPDLKTCPYVRVATGQSTASPGKDPEPDYQEAFLLKDHGTSFTVLGLDLEMRDLQKSDLKGLPAERVGYDKIDLAQAVRARLDALKAGAKERDPWARLKRRASPQHELFVLARGCDRQGQPELARELLDAAAKMPDPRTGQPLERPLVRVVADEIANNRVWKAVLEFGDPEIPRGRLLDTFREIQKRFPDCSHAPMVKETVELLEKMAKEDEAHVEPRKPLAQLPVGERVAELIFRLRDQNGRQWSQPGQCDFFNDPKGEESPAHLLVKMDADAVPQLIDALDDLRFTRSVGFHRNFYFSHHVLRVGDAALAILSRIAGKTFWDRNYTNGAMTKDGGAKAAKVAAVAWWSEHQKKGEKQVLIEATEKGDLDQAQRLFEKYPEAALPAVRKALPAAKDGWSRGKLVHLVSKIPGEETTSILLAEVKEGPHLGTRMAAARELVSRGHPDVLNLVIAEWKKSAEAKRNREEDFFERPTDAIIGALVATGRAEAIHVLRLNLGKRPLELRVAVMCGVSDGADFFDLERGDRSSVRPPGLTAAQQNEAAQAAEDLLGAELDDIAVSEGRSGSKPGWSFSDPRLCDIAAHILAHRWPKRYTFDLSADRRVRDRQLAEVKNVWRLARGLEPVPVPEVKDVSSIPAEQVDPLVDALLRGDAGADAALAAKGIPALKVAQARLTRLGKEASGKSSLESVTKLLGCIVSEAAITPVPARKDDALAAAVKALEGRTLNKEGLKAFLVHACGHLPEGTVGYRITLERGEDLSGVRVLLETLTEKVPRGGSVPGWAMSEQVSLGKQGLLHFGGSAGMDYGTSDEGFQKLDEPVGQVLSAPASSAFSIRISRVWKD